MKVASRASINRTSDSVAVVIEGANVMTSPKRVWYRVNSENRTAPLGRFEFVARARVRLAEVEE
jgi:phosphodiesterase/alkaline phosphatase D-like protein